MGELHIIASTAAMEILYSDALEIWYDVGDELKLTMQNPASAA